MLLGNTLGVFLKNNNKANEGLGKACIVKSLFLKIQDTSQSVLLCTYGSLPPGICTPYPSHKSTLPSIIT